MVSNQSNMANQYVNDQYENSKFPSDEDALKELTAQLSQFNWKEGVVDRAKRLIYSSDIQENLKGVISLKAMLCIRREEIYEVAQEVIDSGVISRLVHFLDTENRDLQWASAFCLTNVAAGLDTQTEIIVRAGAITPLIRFLRDPDIQLKRQAIFCLANIAGSTPEYRIILARNPNYFPDIFAAASTPDPKFIELVCWNLRNVCYLGGPTFEEILPGIQFLVNKIFAVYWNYPQWSQCIRFAIETIGSVCRLPQGREAVQSEHFILCILSLLELLPENSYLISQSALETLSWILMYGHDYNKEIFVRRHNLIDIFVDEGIQGHSNFVIQELCLKCLVCIAMDSKTDLFLHILQKKQNVLNITGRIFLGISEQPNCSSTHLSSGCQQSIRECAAFLFSNCILYTFYIPDFGIQILVSEDIVKILLQIVEYCSEQLSISQSTIQKGETHYNDSGNGVPIPSLLENITLTTLKAMLELLRQGDILQERDELPENLVVNNFLQCDSRVRLETIIKSTVLPTASFEIAKKIDQKLLANSKKRNENPDFFKWNRNLSSYVGSPYL